jgi:hypothetical protein
MATKKSGGKRKSPGPMHSRKQWGYLFAQKKPFAKKWADQIVATRGKKTGYHSLPVRKGPKKR